MSQNVYQTQNQQTKQATQPEACTDTMTNGNFSKLWPAVQPYAHICLKYVADEQAHINALSPKASWVKQSKSAWFMIISIVLLAS